VSASDLTGTSILISDIDRRKALPVIRSLGRAGVTVIGFAAHRGTVGGLSRYCDTVLRSPDPADGPDAFATFLRGVVEKHRPDTYLPLEDITIEWSLARPEAWQSHTRALLPDTDVMDAAYDKWKTIEAARAAGVAVPDSHCPEDQAGVAALADRWTGPAVIKPRKTSGSRGMRFVDDPGELVDAWTEVAAEFPRPIIQHRIPAEGAGLGVFALIDDGGTVVAVFGHRRLREYPVTGGPSTLRVSHRDDALIEQSLRLLRDMEFRGAAMVEYKEDSETGTPVLMEVNPRFWGSMQLAISSGVDFPVLYHRLTLGLPVEPVLEYRVGVQGRWLLPGDVLHFLTNPKRFSLAPSFFRLLGKDLHYDIVSWRDPLPMAGIVIEGMRRLRRR
jgi:predicted ATP-grasp superfamily ATP-dependent carboligase